MYYTVIKHSGHLRTLKKCRKHSPVAHVYYISVMFSNGHRVLSQFIIWLVPQAGKMNQIARCDRLPEWARWSHLARPGPPAVSRKQNFPKSHIINPLLTKFDRSRWSSSRSINMQKKNLANIQPS